MSGNIKMSFQELNRERVKAAATAKLLQEKAEEHLRAELQRKVYFITLKK